MMKIETIVTGAYQENCYLLWNEGGHALLFDPGDDADLIISRINTFRLEIAAHVCTHAHADHICALAELHRIFSAPIVMHSADWAWAFDPSNQSPPYYGIPEHPSADGFLPLEKQRDWNIHGFRFKCIETPGHTPGSCALLFAEENMLIAGDTLFKGSCGRTDLPRGNPGHLKVSLNKLKQLPDRTYVYPGHGPATTIGHERTTNIFMQ